MKNEFNYRGLTVKIEQDEYAQSPDQWGNEDTFIVYDHRSFYVECKGFNPQDIFDHLSTGKKTYKGYHVFPLYAYIHSGVALSLGRTQYPFNDRWDVSFKGFALVKREKGTYTHEQAVKVAQSLVDTWNMYLSGDVWTTTVENEQGELVESCSGIYGHKYAEQEGKNMVDSYIRWSLKGHIEKLKQWIKSKVDIQYREQFKYITNQ